MTRSENSSKTAKKIIKIAQKLFLENGYSGVSIRDIAKKANVPISLIYHYHENKEAMWKAVKQNILESTEFNQSLEELEGKDFKAYLRSFLTIRFNFYDQNPNIVKLISWQRLEKSSDELVGVKQSSLLIDIEAKILKFQQEGAVKKNIDSKIIAYLILNTITLPFFDRDIFLSKDSKEERLRYIDTVVKLFEHYMT